nr:hypothetical protein [Nonomuraea phyllanthi]
MTFSFRRRSGTRHRREQLDQVVKAADEHGEHQPRSARERETGRLRRSRAARAARQAAHQDGQPGGSRHCQQREVAGQMVASQRGRRRPEAPAWRTHAAVQSTYQGRAERAEQGDGDGRPHDGGERMNNLRDGQDRDGRLRRDDHRRGPAGGSRARAAPQQCSEQDSCHADELGIGRAAADLAQCRHHEDGTDQALAAESDILHRTSSARRSRRACPPTPGGQALDGWGRG